MEDLEASNKDGLLTHIKMEMLQWNKIPPTGVDYICFFDWMKYNNRWIPCRIQFMSTSSRGNYTVIPDPKGLGKFTMEDIIENDTLQYDPIILLQNSNLDTNSHFRVPVNEMKHFLKTTLYKKLMAEDGWNISIATIDKCAYNFLVSYMPADIVYIGPNWVASNVHTEFKMRKKEKRESNNFEMGLLQWDELPQNVNWLAFVDWMRYDKQWIPCKFRFVEVTSKEMYNHFTLVPDSKYLKQFNFKDIIKNKTLDNYPVKLIKECNENAEGIFRVPVYDMNNFLQRKLCHNLKSDEKITIATIDRAAYNLLESLLPANMVYFGPNYDAYEVLEEFMKRFKMKSGIDELDNMPTL